MMKTKTFKMKRRDGSEAEFRYVKQDGVWYWDITWKDLGAMPNATPSLPLPDVNLDKCESLKECFDAIAKKRGENWVGQIFVDAMAVRKK